MRKQSRFWCFCAFIMCALKLSAGDVAVFTDLGFSEDGKTYIFAQYGVEEATLLPWAELCIVDVAANDFIRGGRVPYKHNLPIEAGQDGSGALFRLIAQNAQLAGRYGVNFLRQGIPLYISLENGHNPAGDRIEFRDFDHNTTYRAVLKPVQRGGGGNLSSSFVIQLERNTGTAASNYTIGTPDVRRSQISSYTIKKVLISRDRSSMVFVIEMTRQAGADDAPDVRYMVETLRF
ncbi:MAG: DUF2259 domain-containing protein [Spirochaetaceae bacterium]|jgi:predicted secreted protein|nr:DUF2259 domain-containing protein [Spirochaetaceae bacterium]